MQRSILILLLSALGLRIVGTYVLASYHFYHLDVAVYKHWMYLLHQWTFREMYSNAPNGWGAHLPLHYYILYLFGFPYRWLGFTQDSAGFLPDLIVKLHVFIPEVLVGYLIWRIVRQRFSERTACIAASLFLFHPAILYVSVLYAQPDTIIVFFALLALYLLFEQKPHLSALSMASSLLIKPQALSLLPLYALAALRTWKKKELFFATLLGTVYILVAAYPFTIGRSYFWAYAYVKKLADYYLFTSVYALNVWAYEGFMLSDLRTWGGITLKRWGLTTVYSLNALYLGAVIVKRMRIRPKLTYLMTIVSFYTTYLFATRMSGGRYLMYVLAFYPIISWGSKRLILSWALTSFLILANLTYVYNEFNFPFAGTIAKSPLAINALITLNLFSYALVVATFFRTLIHPEDKDGEL